MTRRTQCIVLALVGMLGIKLVATDAYLRYVHDWMRWPILLASVVLLVLAVRLALTTRSGPAPAAPPSAWLLVLPLVAVFCISPPALGSYAAQRSRPPAIDDAGYSRLPTGRTSTLTMSDLVGRAQWGDTLRDRRVSVLGFVSRSHGRTYVTRMGITCCAADAVVYRARMLGTSAPAEDRWVRVEGTWVPQRGKTPRLGTPALKVERLTRVTAPADTYE